MEIPENISVSHKLIHSSSLCCSMQFLRLNLLLLQFNVVMQLLLLYKQVVVETTVLCCFGHLMELTIAVAAAPRSWPKLMQLRGHG